MNSTTCSVASDCNAAGLPRHDCSPDGYCECEFFMHYQGVRCERSEASTLPGIISAAFAVIYACLMCLFGLLLWRKLAASRFRCDVTMSSLLFGLAASLSCFILHFAYFVDFLALSMDFSTSFAIRKSFVSLSGVFSISSALNVSMMWIEFILCAPPICSPRTQRPHALLSRLTSDMVRASKRLENISSNLRLTKRYTLGALLGYAAGSLLLAVFALLVSPVFEYAFASLMLIYAVFLIATYQLGSRWLSASLRRAAYQLQTVIIQSQTSGPKSHQSDEDSSSRCEPAGEEVDKGAPPCDAASAEKEAFERRAALIVQTAHRVTFGCLAFVVGMTLYQITLMRRLHVPFCIAMILCHVGISFTGYTVARFIRVSLRSTARAQVRVKPGSG